MEETVKIQLDIPKDFSLELDRLIIDFKEVGIKTSKADLILKLARVGHLNEIRESQKIVNNFNHEN